MTDEATITSKPPDADAGPPSPWLSAALSFLLPGAGQAFNGRFGKGMLLLVLSFVILPAESLGLIYLGKSAAWAILPPLLVPWMYSMVNAARESSRLKLNGASFDKRRGAIGVAVLLIVAFPMVALVFSIVTLILLPLETLQQIADWTENVKRACGLGS
jgi:TM2 domain-containing membrane protein YozV